MGIQSTQYVSRETAISRIVDIDYLILKKRYRSLEDCTSESDYNIQEYVDNYTINNTEVDLLEWTDTMLEDKMDEPYYRFSMFDNYCVEGE